MNRSLYILLLALAATACEKPPQNIFNGYVEADYVYISAEDSGRIATLNVKEGDAVNAGDIIFELDRTRLSLGAQQAEASAQATALRVGDTGPLERAVEEAKAAETLARQNLARTQTLIKEGVARRARLDADVANLDMAQARLKGATAEYDAAQKDNAAAEAAAALAEQRVEDLRIPSPESGVIEEIYRRAGEVVNAGTPVVALLPPDNLKLRFFLPETRLASLSLGETITFTCDNCEAALGARISFIAREPQFTPPIIYSTDQRDTLVFLVEARPVSGVSLRPGLPVSVTLP